jgi:hypothetical protein
VHKGLRFRVCIGGRALVHKGLGFRVCIGGRALVQGWRAFNSKCEVDESLWSLSWRLWNEGLWVGI